MFEFLRRWYRRSSRVRHISPKVREHRFRPSLEILENRLAPAVFNVNSTADILNPPPGEVDNAAGEFASAASGRNLTIQNTSGGAVTVDGNHLSRVFDLHPIVTIGSANLPSPIITARRPGTRHIDR
jgi:hypothetical protein